MPDQHMNGIEWLSIGFLAYPGDLDAKIKPKSSPIG